MDLAKKKRLLGLLALGILLCGWVRWREDAPSAQWFGFYHGGEKWGWCRYRAMSAADGVRLTLRSRLMLPLQGKMLPATTTSTVLLDSQDRMRAFTYQLNTSAQRLRVSGTVSPSMLVAHIESRGQKLRRVYRVTGSVYLPDLLLPHLGRAGQLRPHAHRRVTLFDPVAMALVPATVQVGDAETASLSGKATSVLPVESESNGLRDRAWVTPGGALLREESALGWTLLRQERRTALRQAPLRPGTDLVLAAGIPAHLPVADPRKVRMLRLRLSGADLTTLPTVPERQCLVPGQPGVVEIRRETPPRQSPAVPDHAPGMAQYLRAETLLPVDDPKLRAAAQQAVGGTRDAWQAAVRIERWVHDNIRECPTLSVPAALDVLRSRRGDCNEHTVLFVALARAAGIPAESVSGIVYVNGRFLYHAWPRVWVGRWVSMDPTFGQDIADAARVELAHGSLERQEEILPLVGKLQVQVLAVE